MRFSHAVGAAILVLSAAAPARAEDRLSVFASAREINASATRACAAVTLRAATFESVVDVGEWTSVRPKASGSKIATHAWRSRTLNTTYLTRLPNGGCSFSIDDGEAKALRAQAMEFLGAMATFTPVRQEQTRGGAATRYAYCTAGPYPVVATMVVGTADSKPRFVFNLFKASTPKPGFCDSAI